ncbi:MAG: transglutaminase family protein [Candidatus Velthaea sp.]
MDLATKPLTIRVGCEFRHTIESAVPAIFLVRPSFTRHCRLVDETWATVPGGPYHDYTDLYGNVCRRVTLPPGESIVTYEARVAVDGSLDPIAPDAPQMLVENLPDDVLLYTLPSRFCLSDEMANTAWQLFGHTTPGWERVQAICDYVHDHITFGYGSSTPTTTSSDVFAAGAGVCRDYAHLAIAFTRAMNIPARYAFGYIPDIDVPPPYSPMDFCAWFEAFLGGRWWTFDARNNQRRRGRILIARGRDALDVAMVTTFGNARFDGMTVVADETDL